MKDLYEMTDTIRRLRAENERVKKSEEASRQALDMGASNEQMLIEQTERLTDKLHAQQPFVEWVRKLGVGDHLFNCRAGMHSTIPMMDRACNCGLSNLRKTLQEQEGADKTPVTTETTADLIKETLKELNATVIGY